MYLCMRIFSEIVKVRTIYHAPLNVHLGPLHIILQLSVIA